MRRSMPCAALLFAMLALPGSAAVAQPPRLAVFDFEQIDTSLEGEMSGPRADEQQRLKTISDQLRLMLAKQGYTLVELTSAAEEIAKAAPLYRCNGCAVKIAELVGAGFAVTGTVQKVSNLILNINVFVSDAKTGQERTRVSVDIRGNNDESWARGVSYLVRNRLTPALERIGSD